MQSLGIRIYAVVGLVVFAFGCSASDDASEEAVPVGRFAGTICEDFEIPDYPLPELECVPPPDSQFQCEVRGLREPSGHLRGTWRYDARGRMVAAWEGSGRHQSEHWEWHADGVTEYYTEDGCVATRTLKSLAPDDEVRFELFDRFGNEPRRNCRVHDADEQGRILSKWDDPDCDCVGDLLVRTWAYDDDARSVTERSYGGDGVAESDYKVTTYDEDGRVLKEEDYLGEGELRDVVEYTYDGDGRVLTRHSGGSGSEGGGGDIWIYTYDERGNQVLLQRDEGADGTVDRTTRHTYDDMDQAIKAEEDKDGDGIFELVTTYEYDPSGQLVLVEVVVGERVASRTQYQYSGGRMVLKTAKRGDTTTEIGHIYDQDGRLVGETFKSEGPDPGSCEGTYQYEGEACPLLPWGEDPATAGEPSLFVCRPGD